MTLQVTLPKQRKLALENRVVIERLCNAGFWKNGEPWVHDDKHPEGGPFSTMFEKGYDVQYSWGHPPVWSYMVPVNIYKEHVQSRYRVVLPVGTQVRKRDRSTRIYVRSAATNVMGDTYSWDHLGIGTGAIYKSQRVDEAVAECEKASKERWGNGASLNANMKVLIGNNRYPANYIAACKKATRVREMGKKIKAHWYHREIHPTDYVDYVQIRGDGVLGPKKTINGVITDVFVHFLYPKWERKRESRFKVQFETGASGIFTSDYLDKVFDTDYEPDESLCYCDSVGVDDMMCTGCGHKGYHFKTPDCETICWKRKRNTCRVEYDYDQLINTTSGKGLEYDGEKA